MAVGRAYDRYIKYGKIAADGSFDTMIFVKLHELSTPDVCAKLLKIPKTVKSVYLGLNTYSGRNSSEFIQILSTIPKNVNALNLDHNHLDEFKKNELAGILKSLPENISKLGLRFNNLTRFNFNDLTDILSALPFSIRYLDLSSNRLHFLTKERLVKVINSIQAPIQSLNLSHNFLQEKPDEYLEFIVEHLPLSVKKVIVEDNSGCENKINVMLQKARGSFFESICQHGIFPKVLNNQVLEYVGCDESYLQQMSCRS